MLWKKGYATPLVRHGGASPVKADEGSRNGRLMNEVTVDFEGGIVDLPASKSTNVYLLSGKQLTCVRLFWQSKRPSVSRGAFQLTTYMKLRSSFKLGFKLSPS